MPEEEKKEEEEEELEERKKRDTPRDSDRREPAKLKVNEELDEDLGMPAGPDVGGGDTEMSCQMKGGTWDADQKRCIHAESQEETETTLDEWYQNNLYQKLINRWTK